MRLTIKPHATHSDTVELWAGGILWTTTHVDFVQELDIGAYKAVRKGRTINLTLLEVSIPVEAVA